MTESDSINIYMCGSIKKGDDDVRGDDYFWSEQEQLILQEIVGSSSMLLNPAYSPISRADPLTNFGCDVFLVAASQAVVVDLRRAKGIGVGAEMMLARQMGIPVVGWLPSSSPYRKAVVTNVFGEDLRDWVHPFVAALCVEWHDTLELVGIHAKELALRYSAAPKPPGFLHDTIANFRQRYPEFAARVLRDR